MFPPRPLPEGTLVILKSGGPLMTTEMGNGKDVVAAVWFDGPALNRNCFHIDALAVIACPCQPNDDAMIEKAMREDHVRGEPRLT